MKRIAKSLLKGVLVVFLFTGVSVALSTTGVNTVSEANAATYNQVNEYLITNGYTVLDLEPGVKLDWVAHTIKDGRYYITTVYCNVACVIGNSDSPM